MTRRRPAALALTLLGVLTVTVAIGQKEDAAAPAAGRLDPDAVTVRLLLGVGDAATRTWSGRVRLDQGEILGVEGHRFRKGDRVTGRDSWEASSLLIRKAAAAKAVAKARNQGQAGAQGQGDATKVTGPGTVGPTIAPNGVLVTLKAPKGAKLAVETDRGRFDVPLDDLAGGEPRRYLDGRVEAQVVAPGLPLVDGPGQDDFPAAATDGKGTAWVAYVRHVPRGPEVLESFRSRPNGFAGYAPDGGGDQVRLLPFAGGRPGPVIDVTAAGLDVWRPAVAVDGAGGVVVAWSANRGGNWDLFRRRYDPKAKAWSEPRRLTTDPGSDTDVALATAPDGRVWMTWQGWRDGQADVFVARVEDAEAPLRVEPSKANQWSPALAIDRDGTLHVAYDTYESGNYDVHLWRNRPGAEGATDVVVAGSPRFEARPSLAIDLRGRAWIAYEERDASWGKDAENLLEGKGSTLYRSAAVKVRRVEGDRVSEAPDPLAGAPQALVARNSYPKLGVDREGRLWLAFRHRQEAVWGGNAVMVVGGVWVEYATTLGDKGWAPPLPLPRSDGLLDLRPALVSTGEGPLLAFYSSDGRLRREVEFTPELSRRFWAHSGTPGTPDAVFNEDLEVAALVPPSDAKGTGLDVPLTPVAASADGPRGDAVAVHPDEEGDVARIRGHRIKAGGKTYRLFRGDFHRHTELSQDGGSDGSLEDMWRYAIDAAKLDWMGDGDHDNGGGKEYTWWLAQKTTDLYNSPSLVTLFTYERSVAYPHGHRNVMFPTRGIRTLPRLVDETGVVDEDTPMLYDYLKEHGGICASHTSATGMGTDWRDVNPQFEPIVEIFQGHRNSYEHLGAPRVARRPGEAIGGWKPLGMVWNALGMQYRFGFQASSDHISTHISFAVAIAEETTRASVFDAFRRRHCYGATDNIVLDVRSGDHLMGDEFDADGPVRLKVSAIGTRPIAKVDIIKDFVYVFSTEPNRARVEFEWKDDERRPAGLSWYYVRLIQDDGAIAWGSPIWVHFRGPTTGR